MPTPAEVIAMGVVMPVVDAAIVFLRFYARRGGKYGIDDFLVLFALIIILGLGAMLILGAVSYGFGLNGPATTPEAGYTADTTKLHTTRKITDVYGDIECWMLGATKLSFIFFYRRIFCGRTFNIISWATALIVILWVLANFFLSLFQCGKHIAILFTSAENVSEHCMEGESIALFYASVDAATDVVIILMPIYWVSKLKMSRAKKYLICCVFLFGALAIAASVARLIIFVYVYGGHNQNPNQYGYATNIAYFSMLEDGLAVIACCLPTLGLLLTDAQKDRLRGAASRLLPSKTRSNITASHTTQSFKGLSKKRSFSPSMSQTQFVPLDSAEARAGFEAFAVGDLERGPSHEDGRILVTRDTSQKSSHL